MVDKLDPEKRSALMRAVHSENTTPEITVRRAAHRLGLRFRLHDKRLVGKPDLVFPRWRTVVFVNGCFWHRHQGCSKSTTPKTNIEFWLNKFSKNICRDECNRKILIETGWKVLVIWQCQVPTIRCAEIILEKAFNLPLKLEKKD